MQWLIDICAEKVIATIGIPPVYVDRGDPDAYDFELGDFTQDDAWHDMDLSGIIPVGTTAAAIWIRIRNILVGRYVTLREKGNVNALNRGSVRSQVGEVYMETDLIISVDEDRKIQYLTSPAGFNVIQIVVKGWWL